MMNQETRIAIINKEIEVYNSYISLIPIMEKVIRKFDNKCINKKFETALDEAANNGKTGQERKFRVAIGYGYAGQFEISVYAYDDSVKEITDKEYPNYHRVENNEYTFVIPKGDFEITNSGNYRIKAEEVIETLYECKDKIRFRINALHDGLAYADEMIEEMKRIKAEFEAFNNKYPYHIRDIMGVYFELIDNGSYEYKNYDI